MAKLPRLTAREAEKLLLSSKFKMIRSKGSHRIYIKGNKRIVVPFHGNKVLHPKIVKQVFKSISE
ncbi:MAG: type II toxin-antitoxin system HicA family toxin [candidate division WOR-3 bacterium]